MKIYIWILNKLDISFNMRTILFSLFLIGSCTMANSEEEKIRSVDNVIAQELSHLSTEKYKVELGYGLDASRYSYGTVVRVRSSEAVTKETLSLENTGKLIQNILLTLNNIPSVRPYLSHFPLEIQNLAFRMFYEEKRYSPRFNPYITSIENYHTSTLDVEICDKNVKPNQGSLWGPIENITLEVPKQYIPPEGGWATPRKYEKTKNTIPIYRGREVIRDVSPYGEQKIFSEVYQLGYVLGLNFAVLGNANKKQYGGSAIVGAGYWAQRKIELEEAKKLAHTIFHKFFSIVFNNYDLWCRSKGFRRHPDCKDMSDEQFITFRVSFWDEFLNRIEEPYIAQIQCENGKIIYYRADEGQRLYKVFEEEAPKAIFQESLVDKFKKLFWKPDY